MDGTLLLGLATAIFSAGAWISTVRMMRRDLNGLGRKVREQELWRSGLVRTLIEEAPSLEEAKKFAMLLPRATHL